MAIQGCCKDGRLLCRLAVAGDAKIAARRSQARHGKLAGELDDFLLQLNDIAVLAALGLQKSAPLLQLGIWPLCLELLGDFDPPAGMQHIIFAMP